jgi:hypothetical protein
MSGSQHVQASAKRAGDRAEQGGKRVENSRAFDVLVTVGLLAYGVVHLLVAFIALQLAFTGTSKQASQKGAFAEMASNPVGDVLLWVTAAGLFALTLWQIFEATWGHRDIEQGHKRVLKRLGSAAKAVIYLALGVSAVSTAAGAKSSNSNSGEKSLTAKLMGTPPGRILIIAIGIVVIVVAARLVFKGVRKKFVDDLAGGVGPGVIKLGQIGYTAKGVAMAIVGVLFIVAAITFDPQKAGGLDTALRTLRQQSFGPILLALMALGWASFGLFCFAWSRRVKKT